MAKDKGNDDKLPQRDRSKAAERMAQRRADDRTDPDRSFALNDPNRPSHPDGWQAGGRGDDNR